MQAAAAALFGGGDLSALSPATLGAALREAGSARGERGAAQRGRPDGGDGPRQEHVATPGGPSPRAAPTSTTSASRTPSSCRRSADLIGGSWLVLRRGKKTFAGVEVA